MNTKEYYTPPSQEVFDDIKQGAICLWKTYDDTYGYASEKIARIEHIANVGDNYAYMVAMFDYHNQNRLKNEFVALPKTKKLIQALYEYSISSF